MVPQNLETRCALVVRRHLFEQFIMQQFWNSSWQVQSDLVVFKLNLFNSLLIWLQLGTLANSTVQNDLAGIWFLYRFLGNYYYPVEQTFQIGLFRSSGYDIWFRTIMMCCHLQTYISCAVWSFLQPYALSSGHRDQIRSLIKNQKCMSEKT